MSVIPELAQVFETKVRAPYRAVFEVCKLSELKRIVAPGTEEKKEDEGQTGGTEAHHSVEIDDNLMTENPFAADTVSEELDSEFGDWETISAKDL